MSASKIEWTEVTWNPTTGCDRISPGCDNCYAMTMARRLTAMGSPKYQNDGDPRTSGPGFGVTMHSESVFEPILKWPRNPRMAFLDSMSDVFHARVWADFLGRVFATMALTPQHTYQILTKRPNRMRELLTNGRVHAAMRTALVDVSISDRCKLARRDNQLDASPGGHMSMAVAECVAGNVDRV